MSINPVRKEGGVQGVIVGAILFILMLADYLTRRQIHSFPFPFESIGAIVLLPPFLFLSLKRSWELEHRPSQQLLFTMWRGLQQSAVVGVIWGGLSYVYVIFVNSAYVNEMIAHASSSLPAHATAAESVGIRLGAELAFEPITMFLGKLVFTLLFGIILSLAIFAILRYTRNVGKTGGSA